MTVTDLDCHISLVVPRRRFPPRLVPSLRTRHNHRGHHSARDCPNLRPRRPSPVAQCVLCPRLCRKHTTLVQVLCHLLSQEALHRRHRALHGCFGPLRRGTNHQRLHRRQGPRWDWRHGHVHGPPDHPLRQYHRHRAAAIPQSHWLLVGNWHRIGSRYWRRVCGELCDLAVGFLPQPVRRRCRCSRVLACAARLPPSPWGASAAETFDA